MPAFFICLMQAVDVVTRDELECLESTVQSNSPQAIGGSVEWVEPSVRDDLCQKDSSKSENEGLQMVVRPAMMHGLETMALRKGLVAEMVAELKTFGFSLGPA